MQLNNQNKDLLDKVLQIQAKMKTKEEQYVEKLKQVEINLSNNKSNVNSVLHDINTIKENIYIFNKEGKLKIKALEIDILEAEKTLCKFKSYCIS